MPYPTSPKRTLQLILLPMLATFVCQRLYLHLVRVQHVYPAGYLVHHLFIGALIENSGGIYSGVRHAQPAPRAVGSCGAGHRERDDPGRDYLPSRDQGNR
jgi:hypothetical protein